MSSDAMLGRRAVAGNAGGGQRGPGHWAASVMDRCADSEPVNTVSSEPARSHEQTGGGWGVCARQRLSLLAGGKARGDSPGQNGTWEIRPSRIVGGPRETWLWWNCDPTVQSKEHGWKPSAYGARARVLSRPVIPHARVCEGGGSRPSRWRPR
jgi:hypothetical protein